MGNSNGSWFFKSLTNKTRQIYDEGIQTTKKVKNYNPEKCQAYNFSRGGHQIRETCKYKDEKKEHQTSCKKRYYPESNRTGKTYLYLMLDPIHGHCYGFHLIGNERAKDVFTPLVLFKETAPTLYVADNSCILEAYCLNRERESFSGTLSSIMIYSMVSVTSLWNIPEKNSTIV